MNFFQKKKNIFHTNHDSFIQLREFQKLTRKYPTLLSNILKFQNALIKTSMGEQWWYDKRSKFVAMRKYIIEENLMKK